MLLDDLCAVYRGKDFFQEPNLCRLNLEFHKLDSQLRRQTRLQAWLRPGRIATAQTPTEDSNAELVRVYPFNRRV